jgi:RNA polymerase primary sigma factor
MMDELLMRYRSGESEALNQLVCQFSNKMKALSYNYHVRAKYSSLERDDIEQEGWIAFIDAADKYEIRKDSAKSCSFSTYAWTAAEFAMRNAIRNNRPRGYKTCDPSERMILHSLDKSSTDGNETWTLYDFIPNEDGMTGFQKFEDDEYNRVLRNDLLQLLDAVLGGTVRNTHNINNECLLKGMQEKPYAKNIMLLHYGLFGKAMTFNEIAQCTNYTASYIGDIESKAIWKIKNSIPGKHFMRLYEINILEDLRNRRKSINSFLQPDKIVGWLESIDEKIEEISANNNRLVTETLKKPMFSGIEKHWVINWGCKRHESKC